MPSFDGGPIYDCTITVSVLGGVTLLIGLVTIESPGKSFLVWKLEAV